MGVKQTLAGVREGARGALRRLGIRTVRLDADEMISAARRRTGLSDLGDDTFWRASLDALVASFDHERAVPPRTVRVLRKFLVHRLVNRLRIEDLIAREPAIVAAPVTRPVFIVSAPRSGSTFFHRLLAADPANRSARLWEMIEPVPPPEEATYETDPRIARVTESYNTDTEDRAERQAMHYVDARLPEECTSLFANDGLHLAARLEFALTSYARWCRSQDLSPVYRGHKRQLQILQHRFHRDQWVLKSPYHQVALDPLLGVYPDARIVWLHRDPLQVVPSLAKLVEAGRRASGLYAPISPAELGADVVQRTVDRIDLALSARGRHEADGFAGQIVDVHYDDLTQRPLETVRTVYGRLDIPWTAAAEQALSDYVEANPRHKHGRYSYSLEEYGLEEAQIRQAFADYAARFGIWP